MMKKSFKKAASALIALTMLGASCFAVSASGVTEPEVTSPELTGPSESWSLLYSQDFENEADTTFAAAQNIYGAINTTISREQIDGTFATHIKGSDASTTAGHATYSWATSSKTIGTIDDATMGIDGGCVAQFDVYKVSDGLPITVYWRSYYLNTTNAVGIPTSNFPENNRWYTVTVEAKGSYWRDNKSGKVWVSIKDKATGEVTNGTYFAGYIPFSKLSAFGFVCDARVAGNANAANFGNLGYITGSGTAIENAAATDYYIDNVKVYNRTDVVTTGVNLYMDWDSLRGDGAPAFTGGAADIKHSVVTEANGNTYRTFEALKDSNQYMNYVANGDKLEMGNGDFVISLDVVKLNEGDSLHIGYNSGVIDPSVTTKTAVYTYGFGIPACTVEKDVWYTYRIVKKDDVMTAYRKTRDGEDAFVEVGVESATNTKYQSKYGKRIPVLKFSGSYTNTSNTLNHYNNSLWLYCPKNKPVNRPALGCTGEAVVTGTKWGYDNLVVSEGNAMTVESINNGLDANVRATKVTLRTADANASALPMVAYFYADNRFAFVNFDSDAERAATDISSAWYFVKRSNDDAEGAGNCLDALGEGATAKAFAWNAESLSPLAEALDVTNIVK